MWCALDGLDDDQGQSPPLEPLIEDLLDVALLTPTAGRAGAKPTPDTPLHLAPLLPPQRLGLSKSRMMANAIHKSIAVESTQQWWRTRFDPPHGVAGSAESAFGFALRAAVSSSARGDVLGALQILLIEVFHAPPGQVKQIAVLAPALRRRAESPREWILAVLAEGTALARLGSATAEARLRSAFEGASEAASDQPDLTDTVLMAGIQLMALLLATDQLDEFDRVCAAVAPLTTTVTPVDHGLAGALEQLQASADLRRAKPIEVLQRVGAIIERTPEQFSAQGSELSIDVLAALLTDRLVYEGNLEIALQARPAPDNAGTTSCGSPICCGEPGLAAVPPPPMW